jgi:hypothetical protein
MKRNFDFVFKNLNGTELKDGDSAAIGIDASLSLKSVSVNSLMATFEADKNLSGDEKLKRYLLAVKINAGSEVDLTAEEITLLKVLIGRSYPPLVVGQAYLYLEKDEA